MKTNIKYNYLLYNLLGMLSFSLILACNSGDECIEITWYQDADGDGLGNNDISLSACEAPTGYVSNADDDDDLCAGIVDECGVCDGPGELTWYQDSDGDGLGNPEVSENACEQPDGFVENADDDDDNHAVTDYLIKESLFNSSSLISFW